MTDGMGFAGSPHVVRRFVYIDRVFPDLQYVIDLSKLQKEMSLIFGLQFERTVNWYLANKAGWMMWVSVITKAIQGTMSGTRDI